MAITKVLSFLGEGGGVENSDHYLRDRRFRRQIGIKPLRARGGHFVWAWLWLCLSPFQREGASTKFLVFLRAKPVTNIS